LKTKHVIIPFVSINARLVTLFIILFLFQHIYVFAEVTGEEHKILWEDLKNFNIDNQKYSLLIGSGIVLTSFFVDKDVKDSSHHWKSDTNKALADFGNIAGNPVVDFSLAGILYASAKKDTTFEKASFTAMESVFVSTAITEMAAYSIGRKRPDQNTTSTTFKPFSGSSSFPSGHSASSMAFFSSYAMYYGAPYSYLMYAAFATTAFGRIYENKHYLSDTLMGGTIGYVTTSYLYERHKNLKKNVYIPMMFSDGRTIFLGFTRQFEI